MVLLPESQKAFDANPHILENYQAYQEVQQDLETSHWGKTVVIHEGKVDGIYNDRGDAYAIGCDKFGLGHFYLHTIGNRPVSLGIHGLAILMSMNDRT